jgi:hypothetical protein
MNTERRKPRGPRAGSRRNALKVVVVAVTAIFLGLMIQCAPNQQTNTNTATPTPQGGGATARRYGGRTGYRKRVGATTAMAATQRGAAPAATACPAVTPQQIYRFVAGADTCMTQMSAADIASELNDPWAVTVLQKNAGGAGPWPQSVADVGNAINKANPGFQVFSYMLGEGGQIPASLTPAPTPNGTPVDANRNLRYVVTWGQSGASPVIFLSGVPDGLWIPPGAEKPLFLQVISFDPNKKMYNYYQYVSDADLNVGPDTTRTWSWAGDSGDARTGQPTEAQGCFACHRIGALNMKELTSPWNNWNSPQAGISPAVVNPAVAADPLFQNLSGADKFQNNVFQGAQFSFVSSLARGAISGGVVSNVPDLLKHLTETTTVNFAASQVRSASGANVSQLSPADFFLYDSALNGVLGLSYTRPQFNLAAADYSAFLTNNKFALVNTSANSLPPDYSVPGATYFAFFIPVPAFEDTKMIQQLVNLKVVSPQFAAAVLMVDFQNPVFSRARSGLTQYVNQITSGKADGADIPNQFAALVKQAASTQPTCDNTKLSQCTGEQQFLYYFGQSAGNWKGACVAQINSYIGSVNTRIATTPGVNDYMTLSVSRGVQFQNWNGVCNLFEFDLMLPCTSLGNVFVRMNADGTVSQQEGYTCPTPQDTPPCQSAVYQQMGTPTPTAAPK